MANRQHSIAGLFAVLLALMAQLGAGTTVPQAALAASVTAICHDQPDGTPTPVHHPVDCPICPHCAPLHAQNMLPAPTPPPVLPPAYHLVARPELPPHSTAPPFPQRPGSQPRAPPTLS